MAKHCAVLYPSDACNTNIRICGGPYATEEECLAACNPSPPSPEACISKDFNADGATVTVSAKTGGASCLDTTPLVTTRSTDLVSFEDSGCGGFGVIGPMTMSCSGGVYVLSAPGSGGSVTFLGGTTSPFSLSWLVTFDDPVPPGGGTAEITVTSP